MAEFKGQMGDRQRAVLRALREHGGWSKRCGWVWTTERETELILESLVKRGLVSKGSDGVYRATSSEGFL